MSLSNLPTGTVSNPEERGVRGAPTRGSAAGQRGQPSQPGGGPGQRVEQLEAELEAVRAERDRLRKERDELVGRYEHLLQRAQPGHRATEMPSGDSLRLRLARLLGFR